MKKARRAGGTCAFFRTPYPIHKYISPTLILVARDWHWQQLAPKQWQRGEVRGPHLSWVGRLEKVFSFFLFLCSHFFLQCERGVPGSLGASRHLLHLFARGRASWASERKSILWEPKAAAEWAGLNRSRFRRSMLAPKDASSCAKSWQL